MGKPLSAAHKAKISASLKARAAGKPVRARGVYGGGRGVKTASGLSQEQAINRAKILGISVPEAHSSFAREQAATSRLYASPKGRAKINTGTLFAGRPGKPGGG